MYSTVTNSYWDIETSGRTSSSYASGKTTEEMKDIETYENWDISEYSGTSEPTTTWFIKQGSDYPKLSYEWKGETPPQSVVTVFQIGICEGENYQLEVDTALNVASFNVDITTQEKAQEAIAEIDGMIEKVERLNSSLGVSEDRLDSIMDLNELAQTNIKSAKSAIEDADMAKETSDCTQYSILSQISKALLVQANQNSEIALQLLPEGGQTRRAYTIL